MTEFTETSDAGVDNDFYEKPPSADTATAQAYAACFDTPAGHIVVADLTRIFGGNPFQAGAQDVTAYKCGCLKVVEHILSHIDHAQE